MIRVRAAFPGCVLVLFAALASALEQLASAQDKPASTQDKFVRFDPVRDLARYEAVRASPDKDLYPLDAFDALLGNEMAPAELAATKKRWEDECAAIDKKLADLAADPRAAFVYRMQARLGRHPYFSKIGWEVQDAPAPFVFVVQRPSKEDPEHARKIAQLYEPWLSALSKFYDARVAEPTKTKPNAALGAVALAVLATPGDYQTAARYLDGDVSSVASGIHDGTLRIDVGHDDPFARSKSARGKVRPLVTVACIGLLQRHGTTGGVPGSVLLTNGLPPYAFEALGDGVTLVDAPRPRADALNNAISVLQDPRKRIESAFRLPDLLALIDGPGTGGLEVRQARKLGAGNVADRRAFWDSFDHQCALWTHYLLDGDGGAHRARWIRYTQEVLSGKPAPDASKIAFEGADLVAIERAFWTWVVATTKAAFPATNVAPDVVESLLAPPPPPSAAKPAAATDKPAAVAPPEPPLDPKVLAILPEDLDSRIGISLLRARENDLDGALALLREIAATKPADPYAGRVEREIVRVGAIVALRDGWLAAVAAKSGRIELEIDGKKVGAPVQRVENGAIVFAANKAGLTTLPLASLRLADILRATDKKEFQAGSEPWVRGYLATMCGDAKAEKLLKGESEALRDLREDARVWIPETVRAGGVARVLDAIASKPLPKTRAEGEAGIASVRALLAEDDLPTVVVRRPNLARYARASFEAAASGMDAREFVHGELADAPEGGVRLLYEFKDPAEVADFVKHAGYLTTLRALYPPITTTEDRASVHAVDGRAVFLGPASWRLPLGFQAPFQIRYRLRFDKVQGQMTSAPTIGVLLCDDGQGAFVRATEAGFIWATDPKTGSTAEADPQEPGLFHDGVEYEIEIVHDGARVTTRFDGADRASCNVGRMVRGDLVLFVHADRPVSIDRLEIVGRLDPASIERARRAWVARQMAEASL